MPNFQIKIPTQTVIIVNFVEDSLLEKLRISPSKSKSSVRQKWCYFGKLLSNNNKSMKSPEIWLTYSWIMTNWHILFLAQDTNYNGLCNRFSQALVFDCSKLC